MVLNPWSHFRISCVTSSTLRCIMFKGPLVWQPLQPKIRLLWNTPNWPRRESHISMHELCFDKMPLRDTRGIRLAAHNLSNKRKFNRDKFLTYNNIKIAIDSYDNRQKLNPPKNEVRDLLSQEPPYRGVASMRIAYCGFVKLLGLVIPYQVH